jgi:hypothetical protein
LLLVLLVFQFRLQIDVTFRRRTFAILIRTRSGVVVVVLAEVDVKECDVNLEDEVCSLERMKMMVPPLLLEMDTRNCRVFMDEFAKYCAVVVKEKGRKIDREMDWFG